MRALVVVAVRLEQDAILDAFPTGAARRALTLGPVTGTTVTTPAGDVTVVAGGVGVAACGVSTATALALGEFDAVLSAGIAGGFAGVPIGSVVVGARSVAADLGCETDEAFLTLSDMGLGIDAYDAAGPWEELVTARGAQAGLDMRSGDINTVSTITGTARAASAHSARNPSAAEAMEGFAVAAAAALAGVPFVELRAISNVVGPRDINSWRMADALAAVGAAVAAAFAEPLPW